MEDQLREEGDARVQRADGRMCKKRSGDEGREETVGHQAVEGQSSSSSNAAVRAGDSAATVGEGGRGRVRARDEDQEVGREGERAKEGGGGGGGGEEEEYESVGSYDAEEPVEEETSDEEEEMRDGPRRRRK